MVCPEVMPMRLATLVVAGLLIGASPAFAQIPADLLARAEQGDAAAQSDLGLMYATGEGVPEDDTEAVRWYRLAAAQGNAFAQSTLGVMYSTGEGVPEDDAEAARWYRLAAAQGDASAQFNLGNMYRTGEGVPEDDAEAVRWYRLAAAQGDAFAQSNLGVMYDTGEGVPENTERAYVWFSVAAAGQSGEDRDRAVANRDRASARLTPEQRSRVQALATTCFNSDFTDCGEPE